MSIAWGSLVLLILLLPGILFFVGTYLPEQFTRDAEQRSPLGQLAAALLIALVVHGVLYALLATWCRGRFPCIDLELLLQTINADPRAPEVLRRVGEALRANRWWILSYLGFTCGIGVALGALYGWLVSTGRWQPLTRHAWVYDLSIDGLTYAYVLTHIQKDDRILMYRGFLRAFALQHDGRFAYIVLRDVSRMYLRLDDTAPETSVAPDHRMIGRTTGDAMSDPSDGAASRRRVRSYFIVEGEDIANVVFDKLDIERRSVSSAEFSELVRRETSALGLTMSTAEFHAIS